MRRPPVGSTPSGRWCGPPLTSGGAYPCDRGGTRTRSVTVKPPAPPSGSRSNPPTDRPATAPVTVLAVDDQPIFLRAAQQLVADTPGFEHVGEATCGPDALELAG